MFDDVGDSIVRVGVIFLVFLFATVVLYFTISPAVEAMFDAIEGVNDPETDDEMNRIMPYIRNAMTMAFAVFIATPIVWIIVWVFSREPEERRIRRL